MNSQWYTKRWVSVSLHVLFWALFFGFPFLLRPVMDSGTPHSQIRNLSGFYYLHFLNSCIRMLFFYGNAFLFIPQLAYKKRYGAYVLVALFALAAMLLWDRFFFVLLISGLENKYWNFFVFNLPVFFFILIVSAAYRILRDRIVENQRKRERETENLKTELSFLRSQVSPHFMFNVLNNMVALARKKSDALEPSLIKLSSLLRYMLYETDEDKVLLEKEVSYLQNYIDLQQQRFGKKVAITTCFQHLEAGHTIEPMLLIPFVENAFKHGTGLVQDAQIAIQLTVEKGVLGFSVRNRYNEVTTELKDKTSGIGLSNVKRRLNLLYDKNYSLLIDKKEGWFTVLLHLNLH
jgi:sensor histidine kinase YesM